MEIYTIGFTQKSAERFFRLLIDVKIQRLVDVRLNNVSQLAGFSKRDDLAYFVRELCGASYEHEPLLAPSQGILDEFKKRRGAWSAYEVAFLDLMKTRRVEERLDRAAFAERRSVLLCSEPTAEHCHRRLVVDYLGTQWGDVSAIHL